MKGYGKERHQSALIVQTKKSHIEIEAEKLLNISSNQ